MSTEFPLDGLALEIKAHWRKYRPKMYRQLEEEGRLDQSLHEASERTGLAFAQQVENGLEPPSAWETVREMWAFLPAESDERAEPAAATGVNGADAGALPDEPDPAGGSVTPSQDEDRLVSLLGRCYLTRREQK